MMTTSVAKLFTCLLVKLLKKISFSYCFYKGEDTFTCVLNKNSKNK